MIRFKILDSTVHMRVSDASTINGKDGVTPHIGDNGNWYLGDVDTGNPSRGETGPKGEPGYTPQRGTDYWTAADQNAIVSQAVTKIQPDISGIKDDLATKLPKSPANWEPWTADEQAVARERLGIPGDYELIESFTMTEAGIFDRNTEPDGTPYNFRKLLVSRYYPSTVDVSEATGWAQLYFFNSKGQRLKSECGIPSKTESSNISLFENNLNKSDVKYSRTYGSSTGVAYLCSKPKKGEGWNIGFGNCVRVVVPSSDKEPKNTIIEIYGVRA